MSDERTHPCGCRTHFDLAHWRSVTDQRCEEHEVIRQAALDCYKDKGEVDETPKLGKDWTGGACSVCAVRWQRGKDPLHDDCMANLMLPAYEPPEWKP